MAPDNEVAAPQPLAVVRRKFWRELEVEVKAYFGRYFICQGKPPRSIESQEIVYRSQRHETRFPHAGGRHLTFEKAANLLGTGRDARDVLQAKALANLV
jgi:hypothetical protein